MLPKSLRPYGKAIAPFVASLVAAGAQWVFTGTYDAAEVQTNVLGLVGALLVWVVPNRPKGRVINVTISGDNSNRKA